MNTQLNKLKSNKNYINSQLNPKLYSILGNKCSILNKIKQHQFSVINELKNLTVQKDLMKIQNLISNLHIQTIKNPLTYYSDTPIQNNFKFSLSFKIILLDQPRLNQYDHEIIEHLYQEMMYLNIYFKEIDRFQKQLQLQAIIKNYRKLKSSQFDLTIPYHMENQFGQSGWLKFDVFNKNINYDDVKDQNRHLSVLLDSLKKSYVQIFADSGYLFRYIMFMKYQVFYPNNFVLYQKEEQNPDRFIKSLDSNIKYIKYVKGF